MNKRIYISGKISGLDLRVAEGYFEAIENKLLEAGHTPVNPMKIVEYNPEWEWHQYMIEDLKALFVCDSIIMLENWQDSKGAKVEHAIAKELGMEIYYPYHYNLLFPTLQTT